MKLEYVNHDSLPPFVREDSEILMLGSFPSPKTREEGFYYAHPSNRFWKVMAGVFEEEEPGSLAEKRAFLERNRIALFDTLYSCEIQGASDASIKNPVGADLTPILKTAGIRGIFCTGAVSYRYYKKLVEPKTKRKAWKLPSTSAANALMSLEKLVEAYRVVRTLES